MRATGSRRGRRRPSRWVRLGLLAGLVAAAGVTPPSVHAQLISPGKLASAHQELEGIRNCTQCHRLREQGVDRQLCLDCHAPLADRIARGKGFHGDLPQDDCAACHKDHFGRDFDLLHLDTLRFEHDRTGYGLTGLHVDAGCRSCHASAFVSDPEVRRVKSERGALARTFLGLDPACVGCHESADPHGVQFAERGCEDCHDTGGWEEAPGFDHQATVYPLTGAHRQVECAGCHEPLPEGRVDRPPDGANSRSGARDGSEASARGAAGALRFAPVAHGSCSTCHADPHGGSMRGSCESCHQTGGWRTVNRGRLERTFDHATTGFQLEEAHAALSCASCHDPAVARRLEGIRLSFPRNARIRSYPPPRADACGSCHVDVHEGDFRERPDGGACESCHGQARWLPARFDLARHGAESSFPLEGAHLVTPCAGCHRAGDGELVIRLGQPDCAACHAPVDPHRDQFAGRGCDACHRVNSFSIPDFDHTRTRYPLEGAHVRVTCAGCHGSEPGSDGTSFVRYRPLGTACEDCHRGAS